MATFEVNDKLYKILEKLAKENFRTPELHFEYLLNEMLGDEIDSIDEKVTAKKKKSKLTKEEEALLAIEQPSRTEYEQQQAVRKRLFG